jgi:hypothetical protein
MKKGAKFLMIFLLMLSCNTLSAQEKRDAARRSYSEVPSWAVKTNLLYDLTSTINLATEFKISKRRTLDIMGNYNPWTFSDNKKFKHWLVQPELRFWLCEAFTGHFFGIHALYAHYNVGGIKLPFGFFPALRDHRYQGNLYGAGVSYGYHQVLSSRWSMEYTFGVGYVYTDSKRYDCRFCGEYQGKEHHGYFTPTKLAVSLIYIIK